MLQKTHDIVPLHVKLCVGNVRKPSLCSSSKISSASATSPNNILATVFIATAPNSLLRVVVKVSINRIEMDIHVDHGSCIDLSVVVKWLSLKIYHSNKTI